LPWLDNFLTGRTQHVVNRGAKSESCYVSSKVIQGSVLGPLLFNLYLIDLPRFVTSPVFQYASDSTLYTEELGRKTTLLPCNRTSIQLQRGVITLNDSKCKVMDISNSGSLVHPYVINCKTLQYYTSEKLLGIRIFSDLK
jgi:hypothetical protein